MTLNDRLDYFGRTVNIAARVQSLAGADEILVTDDVLGLPGTDALSRSRHDSFDLAHEQDQVERVGR